MLLKLNFVMKVLEVCPH